MRPGAIISKYAQGQNIDEPLAESTAGATSFYEQDGLGSVTSLSSSAGALANTYTYDSFGKLTNSSGTLTNPFQYTGRELDSETGLYYYRARYYDPSAGRFTNEDPTRFAGGANFYEYTVNDPTGLFDPSGTCPIDLKKFVNWLDHHAGSPNDQSCASHIRQGLQQGGAKIPPGSSPVPAKDWGPYLTNRAGGPCSPNRFARDRFAEDDSIADTNDRGCLAGAPCSVCERGAIVIAAAKRAARRHLRDLHP